MNLMYKNVMGTEDTSVSKSNPDVLETVENPNQDFFDSVKGGGTKVLDTIKDTTKEVFKEVKDRTKSLDKKERLIQSIPNSVLVYIFGGLLIFSLVKK